MKYISLVVVCLIGWSASLKSDDKLTLRSGAVAMVIDPKVSGRIISFELAGKNILSGSEVHSFNYGSTLWPAPQSLWRWPPFEALDKEPYQVILHKSKEILLMSQPDSVSGFQFNKHFYARKGYFEIHYGIQNISSQEKKVAAWEVTRVDTSGRAFFPLSGEGPLAKSNLQNVSIRDNYFWYEPDYENMENSQKYYGYGKYGYLGWITGNLLFVKSFPDMQPDQPAPGQAEIEVFAHAEYPYIELENHGPFLSLQPGESLSYVVKWYLKKIPKELKQGEIIEIAESLLEP